MKKKRLEAGSLGGEHARRNPLGFDERVECAQRKIGPRAETVAVVDDQHLAMLGQSRRQRCGGSRGRKTNLLIERQPGEQVVERPESEEFFMINNPDARTKSRR